MKDLKEIFSSYNGEHCKILKVAFTQTNFAPASHNSHQSMFLDRSQATKSELVVLFDQYFLFWDCFQFPVITVSSTAQFCVESHWILCESLLLLQFEPNAIETWEHPDIKVQYSEERCCSNIQIFIAPQCCKMYPWPCGKRNLCGRYQSKEFIFHVHYTSVEEALEMLKKILSETQRR